MKKNETLNVDEVDQCKEDGCHVASQVWGLSKTLSTLSSWSLEEELKGEREQLMALSLKQSRSGDHDIAMHVDMGRSDELAMTSDTDMWSPFTIDAKGGEMKIKEGACS